MSQFFIPGMNSSEMSAYRKLLREKKRSSESQYGSKKTPRQWGQGPSQGGRPNQSGKQKPQTPKNAYDAPQEPTFQQAVAAASLLQNIGYDFAGGQGGGRGQGRNNNFQGGFRGANFRQQNQGQGGGNNGGNPPLPPTNG